MHICSYCIKAIFDTESVPACEHNIFYTKMLFKLSVVLSINNGIISSKICDKRDNFDFAIVNHPHLDGEVPRPTSYGVYISQLIRFARACSSDEDFHFRNRTITEKLLKQGYIEYRLSRC